MMENANCDKTICSVDKESILVEHDYCRSVITCDTLAKKDDYALVGKSTSCVVEKLTDGQFVSVQARNVDDWNEIVVREIAVQQLHCRFLSEKEIREKVCKKLGIPAVMGDFLSRASKKLNELIPENLSTGHKKSSTRTAPPGMPARRAEKSEMTSRERSVFESGPSSSYSRQNVTEDSGMISHGSDLSESITPDFELLRDVPMQSRPDHQYLTPALPPSACRQAIAPDETHDASIHSQPTQILAGVCELPNFHQAFGTLVPSNYSNCSSPPPTSTPNYQLSDSQRTTFTGAPEARDGAVEQATQHATTSDCSPPSLTPNCTLSDGERAEFLEISFSGEGNVELGTPYERSNCGSSELLSTENYRQSDRQGAAFTYTPDREEAANDLETQFENSNCCSPEIFSTENYPSDRHEGVFTDMSDRREIVNDPEAQFERPSFGSPEVLSTENYPQLDRQGAAFTDRSNRQETVNDPEAQFESPNFGSPEVLSTENYPQSDRQRATFTVRSDRQEAVNDLETQFESPNFGSPEVLSTENDPQSDRKGYRHIFTDTSDRQQAVNDVETQYENSNSTSPDLFSNENYRRSDSHGTALADTSDTHMRVIDLVSQQRNSNSDPPELFLTQRPLSGSQGPAVTDASDRRETDIDLETQFENSNTGSAVSPLTQHYPLSDKQETVVTDASDNSSALTQVLPRSPSPDISPSIVHEGLIDLKTQNYNSNSNNSEIAQSPTNNLELMDTQQVIDGETRLAYSNDYKVTQSAAVDSKSPDIEREIGSEIAYEISNDLQLTRSTASITTFLDTHCSVDNDDLPTQICTPFCHDSNENRIVINEQTPNSSRGRKRKREEKPESLWTVVEDLSESGSPEIGIVNSIRQLSTAGNADPCRISIGTNLPTPEFLKTSTQNLDKVSLDHSYSEPTRKSSAVRTLKFEDSQSKSYRSGAESVPGKIGKIRAIKEFSGSDSSNTRNFEQGRVRKSSKRKINFDDCKENWPLKKRRLRESSTSHRSTFDSNKSQDSRPRRPNLNDPRESHCIGSLDFSELLSNRCCEYDHTFPNLTSLENVPYEPILLKHLLQTSYKEIKRNIDELLRSFEVSDEVF